MKSPILTPLNLLLTLGTMPLVVYAKAASTNTLKMGDHRDEK